MLDGYKTFIGGIGAIATGIGTVAYNYSEGLPTDWNLAMGWIIGGWAIISGRSLADKFLDNI